MTEEQANSIYDILVELGGARELANWWEDHESADEERLSQDKDRRSDDWMRLFNDGAFSYATSPLHLVEMLIEKGYEAPKLSKEIEE